MSIQQKVNVASAIGLAAIVAATPFLVADRVSTESDRASNDSKYEVVEVYTNYSLPPCDEEDGTATSNGVNVDACYWDASTRGNGTGHSFIILSH